MKDNWQNHVLCIWYNCLQHWGHVTTQPHPSDKQVWPLLDEYGWKEQQIKGPGKEQQIRGPWKEQQIKGPGKEQQILK